MCEHDMLRGITTIARCGVHSRPSAGVQVWTWARTPVTARCPCVVADRFVVAHEFARGRWLSAADVVVAAPQDTTSTAASSADRLSRLPGCLLVFVPLAGGGAVLGCREGHIVVRRSRLCPVCVYPWLVCGGEVS